MADITMCTGDGCPLKETCYRYRAEPEPEHQTYLMAVPFKDGACALYWNAED